MAQISSTDLDCVDDFYFSALFEEIEQDSLPVSDAKYAEELQLQEALMAAASIASQFNSHKYAVLPSSSSMTVLQAVPPVFAGSKTEEQQDEDGESSQSFCEICAERKESGQMFKPGICTHSFCSDCIIKHVSMRIQQRITMVTCPGVDCGSVLELDTCRPLLPKEVIDLWEETLCEQLIGMAQRFYCPFRDCSALLVKDSEGEVIIKEAECPFCHRLFCAECCVPWHPGVQCEEFQRLNEDEKGREDLMVRELAHQKKWSRCPSCHYYVERTEGCPHITCRCKVEFCYGCGSEWSVTHGGCQRN